MASDKTVATRITSEEHRKLQKLADKEYRSLSSYLRIIIKDHLYKKRIPKGDE